MSDSDLTLSDVKLYQYTPNVAAAAIFAMTFLALSILLAWKNYRGRSWYFSAMVIGGLMEGVGYFARAASHNDITAVGPYVVQSILLLVAPALFAASIYVLLGRLMRKLRTERFSPIRIDWLTKFLVASDVLIFLMQSGGGGLQAVAKYRSDVNLGQSINNLGQTIIVAGLIAQIVCFGVFILVSVVFHFRMRVVPTVIEKRSWRTFMYVLYAASTLIMVRSVFRVVEYAGGNDGHLMRREVWLYIFDSVLMAGVITLFNIYRPSDYLRDNEEH
ncbi:RTA1 like protein-domain-containing protein [Armillaria borealis]|uniref:RTA1 like protein-domain-containing protein n=1 Tax=Armillaria borealis TaxID=47425 RepID=A0AA39JMV0_9AGAR|nr:RTA1 like protein-domain-containing protein [Armillaria borealis]